MRNLKSRLWAVLAVIVISLPAGSRAQSPAAPAPAVVTQLPPAPLDAATLQKKIDELIDGHMKANSFSGTILLAKEGKPPEAKIRELYLTAFSREPRSPELQTALDYLNESNVGADGKPVDATKANREKFQDLIWALINTKEFLFNH